jgi:hypothetical protein
MSSLRKTNRVFGKPLCRAIEPEQSPNQSFGGVLNQASNSLRAAKPSLLIYKNRSFADNKSDEV